MDIKDLKKNSPPTLSVLFSAYNAERYIQDALDSILEQTYSKFELIICDDASKDKTRDIIESYTDPRIIQSHNSNNLGKTASINRLYNLSRGRYITVHDADDVSIQTRFEKQISVLESNPQLVLCGTWFTYMTNKDKHLFECKPPVDSKAIKKTILEESVLHGPTVIYRRSALEKSKDFFRPFFNDYNEDADLNMRISEFGECYNFPEFLYKYRVVENSLSKALTYEKLSMYGIVIHLANQRKKKGRDDLQLNQEEKVNTLLQELVGRLKDQKSIGHQLSAEKMMYFGLKKVAVEHMIKAIKLDPFHFNNYKMLQYCLRKWLFRC